VALYELRPRVADPLGGLTGGAYEAVAERIRHGAQPGRRTVTSGTAPAFGRGARHPPGQNAVPEPVPWALVAIGVCHPPPRRSSQRGGDHRRV
jgi:hypothetical protein